MAGYATRPLSGGGVTATPLLRSRASMAGILVVFVALSVGTYRRVA